MAKSVLAVSSSGASTPNPEYGKAIGCSHSGGSLAEGQPESHDLQSDSRRAESAAIAGKKDDHQGGSTPDHQQGVTEAAQGATCDRGGSFW